MIKAEIVADSVNGFGNRLTTMVVTFPRFILAELNTHRMFSRNSASSRAIPFEKMLKSVQENPFIPIAWQKDHKGMQGTAYWTEPEANERHKNIWLRSLNETIDHAKLLNQLGVTKQLCNRLLEPFMWHTVIVTATEWENFFALRCPKYTSLDNSEYRSWKDLIEDKKIKGASIEWLNTAGNYNVLERLKCNKGQAEIHMMALAEAMWDAYNESQPKKLEKGEWHIPFGDQIKEGLISDYLHEDGDGPFGQFEYDAVKLQIAVARCARISYTLVGEEGKIPNIEKDIELHDNLAKSGHWSPFEHIAKAMGSDDTIKAAMLIDNNGKKSFGWSGNLRGFIQYRKTFDTENFRQQAYGHKEQHG